MGLTGKLFDRTKKIFSIVTTLATIAGCSGMQANKTLEEELANLKPAGIELKLGSSEISTTTNVQYNLPEGGKVNLNGKITLDSGKDNPSFFEYSLGDKDFTFEPKGIRVLEAVDDIGNFLPKEKLEQELIDIATGKINLGDAVLFKGQPVTLKDMGDLANELDGFSTTTQGKNFIDYKIDLNARAYATNLTTTSQEFRANDGSTIKFIHGLKGTYVVNKARAYFVFGARCPDSVTLGDLARNNLSKEYEGLISLLPNDISNINTKKIIVEAKAGIAFADELRVEQSAQVETDEWTIGAMQEDSKINQSHSKIYGKLLADPETLSVVGEFGEENFGIEEEVNRNLAYGIRKMEEDRLSVMIGFNNESRRTVTEVERNVSIARLGKNGGSDKRINEKTRTITKSSENEFIYGMAGVYPLLFVPEINTEFLAYSLMTNYPEDERTFGGIVINPWANAIVDTEGNGEAYVTFWGNKINPFGRYFNEKIKSGINPLREEINGIRRRELLRKMHGGFLKFSREDDESRIGGIIASEGDSYLAGGMIEGGYYGSGEILGIGIDASYRQDKDFENGTHGERLEVGLSYDLPNGLAARLQFEGKPDEPTRPKTILFSISGQTYFFQGSKSHSSDH